jgi:uncharacterized membrane protein YuzA (DUF378 family)
MEQYSDVVYIIVGALAVLLVGFFIYTRLQNRNKPAVQPTAE